MKLGDLIQEGETNIITLMKRLTTKNPANSGIFIFFKTNCFYQIEARFSGAMYKAADSSKPNAS